MGENVIMTTRRRLFQGAGAMAAAAGAGSFLTRAGLAAAPYLGPPDLPSGTLSSASLEALPGKKPLIKRSYRPPNYESPIQTYKQAFTPNDEFFVRWHLSDIPEVDAASWRLKVGGAGAETPLELTLDQLGKDFEQVELAAVCQCSGNRRGLSTPHVTGVEWAYGAMGNAKWKGVRLKDILTKAGARKEAVEIGFNGADKGVVEQTPDFIKSVPAWKAMDENTLVATHMNGEPLPHWNGYPARIVVPGWTATYWVKQVNEINVLTEPQGGFWMAAAYRIPLGKFPLVDRFTSQETATNTPITEMVVNSLITNLLTGYRIRVGKPTAVRGIAWDGGYGIARVDVSINGGHSWRPAILGDDLGRFAWRQWHYPFTPKQRGQHAIMARATNTRGATQTSELIFNPAGYHNNVIQTVTVNAV
jgi:DMSO/TMAO reductase YedYZ molybdopterin-dependent catalytic subunit